MRQLVRDLNHIYRAKAVLHVRDCEPEGFTWLIADDRANSVFAWLRSAPGENPVAVVANFTPVRRERYRIPLPRAGEWREIMNTDAGFYGGTGAGNFGRVTAQDDGGGTAAEVTLPPLATLMFEFDPA